METPGTTTGFLESAPGELSSGRLMFILWGLYAMFMCTAVWFQTHDYMAALAIFTAIAGTATAHKGVSSYNENKAPDTKPTTT